MAILPEEQERLTARVAGHFHRPEVRATASRYLATLLEHGGEPRAKAVTANARAVPATRVARLLQTARWDESALRDDLREYVAERLGDDRALLALREEPFAWRGRAVVGVARQYVARTQRWRHCQLGLFLAYFAPGGAAFLDRELYLPPEWTADEGRRQRAGIPADRPHASRGDLAVAMLQRAYLAAVPCGWVVAERAFTTDEALHRWLGRIGYAFLLEVSPVWSPQRALDGGEGASRGVGLLFETILGDDWWRAPGTGGTAAPPVEWARIAIAVPRETLTGGWQEWAVAARPASRRGRERYFVARAPAATTLAELAAIGAQLAPLDALMAEARAVGLGEYRTRAWRGWYRHTTLSMLAHGCRAVIGALVGQRAG